MSLIAMQGGLMTAVPGGGGGGDPDFASVSSLLHFDGTSGSTTFTDQKGLAWTANADAQISTTDPKFGTGCLVLDGVGDCITTPTATAFEFGTGDFTIEAWVRPTVGTFGSSPNILSNRAGGGMTFRLTTGQKLQFFPGPAPVIVTGAITVAAGVYTHVAVCRVAGVVRLFVGGVLDGTLSDSSNYTVTGGQSANTAIGRSQFTGGEFFTGRIDDFRVTKAGRYTTNFTPPTAAFPDS